MVARLLCLWASNWQTTVLRFRCSSNHANIEIRFASSWSARRMERRVQRFRQMLPQKRQEQTSHNRISPQRALFLKGCWILRNRTSWRMDRREKNSHASYYVQMNHLKWVRRKQWGETSSATQKFNYVDDSRSRPRPDRPRGASRHVQEEQVAKRELPVLLLFF